MQTSLQQAALGRLERLCSIRIGSGAEGIERLEAHFRGRAFAPHRHDSYAIGITLRGVQSFRYRGAQHHCLPGQCHVLHPDELHDGQAATEAGFGYRIAYIDPALVQAALGGKALPFVRSPVLAAAMLPHGFAAAAWDLDADIDALARIDIVLAVTRLLAGAAPGGGAAPASCDLAAVSRVRDLIAACPAERPAMAALERLSGLDRWTLARQFRALFGTSPSRFRTQRQLDHLRRQLRAGVSLAAAAAEAGFADQSHMSRRFKRAYGLTPAAWVAAIGAGAA